MESTPAILHKQNGRRYFSCSLVAGSQHFVQWQDLPVFVLLYGLLMALSPPLPVQPEAHQKQRPLPTTCTEAAAFDHVLLCLFPHCSVMGSLLFFETTIPT